MFHRENTNIVNDRNEIRKLCVVLAAALLLELFCIFMTSHYIHIYSGETQEEQGVLIDVWRATAKGEAGIVVVVDDHVVDGQEYQLKKPSFSKKTYGLKNYSDLNELVDELEQKKGSAWNVNVEYVQFSEKYKVALRLTINGEEYIDEAVARRDHIADEAKYRNGAIILFILTVLIFAAAMRRLRKHGNSYSE